MPSHGVDGTVELLHMEVAVGGELPVRVRVAVLETPLSVAVTVAL